MRLPLYRLDISYLELGWLIGAIPEEMQKRMEIEMPALKLRMDILATKAYIKGTNDVASKQVIQMKKDLLKITKTQVQTFQPTAVYLKKLREALGTE